MNKVKITNAACRAAIAYMKENKFPEEYYKMEKEQQDEWEMRAVRGMLIAAASASGVAA
jgi:hypothetical protein